MCNQKQSERDRLLDFLGQMYSLGFKCYVNKHNWQHLE